MSATIALPQWTVVIGGAYICSTLLLGAGLLLLCSPMLIINRPKSAYWQDWNDSQNAPWLFWIIGGLWYRIQELLGNYVLPAPQVSTHAAVLLPALYCLGRPSPAQQPWPKADP
jgi:hypothetical protein